MREIDIVKLRARLNGAGGNGPILVDAHTPAGTVCDANQGAHHIPPHTRPLSVHEVPHENDTAVAIYCQSGARSARARTLMEPARGISGLATGWPPRRLAPTPRTARFQDIPCNILTYPSKHFV